MSALVVTSSRLTGSDAGAARRSLENTQRLIRLAARMGQARVLDEVLSRGNRSWCVERLVRSEGPLTSCRSGSSFHRAEAARFGGFGTGRSSLQALHVVLRDGCDRERCIRIRAGAHNQ